MPSREGWPDFVFAFHDADEIGPRMLERIARHTGLAPRTSEERGEAYPSLVCHPPGASALQAGDCSPSLGHSSIRPQQTRWWKEQAPSRSQAGRVQPGQAQSRVPIFDCSRCMWAAHSLPA